MVPIVAVALRGTKRDRFRLQLRTEILLGENWAAVQELAERLRARDLIQASEVSRSWPRSANMLETVELTANRQATFHKGKIRFQAITPTRPASALPSANTAT